MTRLPILNGKDIIKVLEKEGYQKIRQKGSHIRLECQNKKSVTIPNHTVGRGLLRKILRDAGLTPEEFQNLLKK